MITHKEKDKFSRISQIMNEIELLETKARSYKNTLDVLDHGNRGRYIEVFVNDMIVYITHDDSRAALTTLINVALNRINTEIKHKSREYRILFEKA